MKEIFVKNANKDVLKELYSIGFDSSYINIAKNKYEGKVYKIFNLKPHEANILKQLCLSLGFDCAVSRDTITCKCETTNALVNATDKQLSQLQKKLLSQPFRLKELSTKLKTIQDSTLNPVIINETLFDWKKPYVMGILNVTPDSFSDGGKYNSIDLALEQVKKIIYDGADIIDIGGESTRPNADVVSVEEEISRVVPVIKAIRNENINIPISVDTRNYKTAKLAIEAGANIINDVSGLDYDSQLFEFVANNNIPVVVMHSNNVPAEGKDFTNSDIVEEIYCNLLNKIEKLINCGHSISNIIVDIGIGFGKSQQSNFDLLKRIDEFQSLGVPQLVGLSRKSFIRNEFNIGFDEADVVTSLYSTMLKSVNIHRVHNVSLTKKYLDFALKLF